MSKEFWIKKKRIILLLYLAMAMQTCGQVIPIPTDTKAEAAWDGYKTDQDENNSLFDFNMFGKIIKSGAMPSEKHKKSGRYSAHWRNQTINTDFQFEVNSGLSDWSERGMLKLSIYSEKATNAKIKLILFTDEIENSYFHKDIIIDWVGEKDIKINLSDLGSARNPSLGKIQKIRFVAHGAWSLTADPETDIYISDISLGSQGIDLLNTVYDEETIAAAYDALKDSAAIYAGGANAVNSEGTQPLSAKSELVNGEVMIPIDVFKQYFGAAITSDQKQFEIKLGDRSVSGAIGADNVVTNSGEITIQPSYISEGVIMLPGESIAKALGLCAKTDKKLLIMGTEKAVSSLSRIAELGVNEMNEIASRLSYMKKNNEEQFEAKDFEAVMDNWVASIVGNESSNDTSDPDVQNKIKAIENNAAETQSQIIRDISSKELFKGQNTKSTGDMTYSYTKVNYMAMAYACPGSSLYKNKKLKEDIIYCLEWLTENRYGVDEIAGTGWQVLGFNNWWDWNIGVPQQLIPTLMMMRQDLTKADINKYLYYFDKAVPLPTMSGSNYVDCASGCIGSALLHGDSAKIRKIQALMEKTYLYVDDNKRIVEMYLNAGQAKDTKIKGAGFFTDGSYVLHTLHAMNGAYGAAHFQELAKLESVFNGTKFQYDTPLRDNIAEFFINGLEPLIFGTVLHPMVRGRHIETDHYKDAAPILECAYKCADVFDEETKNQIYRLIKSDVSSMPEEFVAEIGVSSVKGIKDILNNPEIPILTDRAENKTYYNMDKVVHKRDTWGLGVSMSSSRIFNYESINSQNLKGWYLSDGRTEYFLKGKDTNATKKYWQGINMYRLPGTTVDTQQRQEVSISQGNEYLSSQDFVGGVTLNNEYGIATMDLESYHRDEAMGEAPAHTSDLVANKSYFMFDEEVVCLGAGINAKNNNDAEVLTVVDNLSADNTIVASQDETAITDPYNIAAVTGDVAEAENIPENTIDGSLNSKWAGDKEDEIVWTLDAKQDLGYIHLVFQMGNQRKQYFELQISDDGQNWKTVFDGESSGQSVVGEDFDLRGNSGQYIKYINKGNSANTPWVSLAEADIYPVNRDGGIGIKEIGFVGTDVLTADGKEVKLTNDDTDLSNVSWMCNEGKCGYVFPKTVSNRSALKGRWTKESNSYMELWFSHGVNPTDSTYEYILLPGKNAAQTQQYAEADNIEIISNTKDLQAVKHKALNITGAVFRKPGTCSGIEVSAPCAVMWSKDENGLNLSVSDPTQDLTELTLKVSGEYAVQEHDECAEVEASQGVTIIKFNMRNSTGRSMSCKLK